LLSMVHEMLVDITVLLEDVMWILINVLYLKGKNKV